ncbi:hypothetical protein GS415_00680 [Rhodococcus hoagii]|nr:hypothetical protein [Prescottella equi]
MGVYVTSEDVAARFEGQLSSEQLSWIDIKILDAEALLATYIPRLENFETSTGLDQANAKRIISDAILRVLRNPAGLQQEEAGPWRVVRSATAASGSLFFTTDELSAFRSAPRRRVGNLGMAPPRWV